MASIVFPANLILTARVLSRLLPARIHHAVVTTTTAGSIPCHTKRVFLFACCAGNAFSGERLTGLLLAVHRQKEKENEEREEAPLLHLFLNKCLYYFNYDRQ
jgi:hypothetical protein